VTVSFTARPSWQAAPAALHHAVRDQVGVVVDVHDVTGGMTPGPAAVLTLTGGDQVFAKAMSQTINPDSYRLYRQEATVLPALPSPVPAARLHATVETGDWIALIMDAVPGPVAGPPWTIPAVHAAADACSILAGTAAPEVLPPAIDRLPDLDGWAKLAAHPGGLTGWERRHINRLTVATTGWRDWTSGGRLCHRDVRGDNIILNPADGRAVLVDWGCACRAAPWLDRALLAADVMAAGHETGPQTARDLALGLLAEQPIEAARFVIAQAGMWRRNSTLPEHPGMPTHRQWQRDRAAALQPLIEDLLPVIDRRTASRSR
jgi:serine/threonine protein kinase